MENKQRMSYIKRIMNPYFELGIDDGDNLIEKEEIANTKPVKERLKVAKSLFK